MCNASILTELDLKNCATVPSSECEALAWTNFLFNNVLKLFSSWKDFIHELLTVCLFWKHYVTEKREEKFKGEMWFLWFLWFLFLFQNALRHVKCVRRNPRNHLYKKLSNERSLRLKKRIVFLVWFARFWKSSLINKSYCGLRGVNHFAAKTGDQFY